jgi:hypothetical protein
MYSLSTLLQSEATTKIDFEPANPAEYVDHLKDRRWYDKGDRRGTER